MPVYYLIQKKIEALQVVERLNGDVAAASLQTGIPERTLFAWRREQNRRFTALPQQNETPRTHPERREEIFTLYRAFIERQPVPQALRPAANFWNLVGEGLSWQPMAADFFRELLQGAGGEP